MMAVYAFILLCIVVGSNARLPEMDLSSVELIEYWGYPVETHEVATEDGYILTMHRIPHGKVNHTRMPAVDHPKPVFLLQHALVCSSSAYILNLPRQSLGFILAEAGYDVWLGNVRGNTYCKRHVSLNPKSKAFWDFTFQDMAKYDLPAMIDFTLNTTNQKQLYYVGHSQGTLMAFTGLSENKALQEKIKIMFALGPVSRIAHVNHVINLLASFRRPLKFFCNLFNVYEVLQSNERVKSFGKYICPYIPHLCEVFLFMLNGFDKKNMNSTRTPLYLTNIPAGTSEKNLDHYFQMVTTKEFKKYDHGVSENLKRYGTKQPPHYDIRTVQTPVVLIHGSNDTIVTPEDVAWTASHLPNVIHNLLIPGYNHIDYITGINAKEAVFDSIVEIADKAEKEKHY